MIQIGFQPAQQAQGFQPFQLPFQEMYQHMANRDQVARDVDQQATQFLTTIGGIKDVLPEDRPLIAEMYKSVLEREQSLRESVNGDLLNPNYRKGLNNLLIETANDTVIGDALYNYGIDQKQQEILQAYQIKTGNAIEAWNNPYGIKRANYVNARESGRLSPEPIFMQGSLIEDGYAFAKQILPTYYEDFEIKNMAGKDVLVDRSGKAISKTAIKDLLVRAYQEGFFNADGSPGLQTLQRESSFYNFTPEEVDKKISDQFDIVADMLHYDDGKTTILNDDPYGYGKGNDEEEDDLKNPLSVVITTLAETNTFASPQLAMQYSGIVENMYTENPSPEYESENIWTREGGINDLAKEFTTLTSQPVEILVNNNSESGIFHKNINFNIKIGENIYSLNDISNPNTPENIKKILDEKRKHISNLENQYEVYVDNKVAIDDLDSEIRKRTNFSTTDEQNMLKKLKTTNTNFISNINKEYEYILKGSGSGRESTQGIVLKDKSSLEKMEIYEQMLASVYEIKESSTFDKYQEYAKRLEKILNVDFETALQISKESNVFMKWQGAAYAKKMNYLNKGSIQNLTDAVFEEVLSSDSDRETIEFLNNRKAYQEMYKKSYAGGWMLTNQYTHGIGFENEDRKYAEDALNMLSTLLGRADGKRLITAFTAGEDGNRPAELSDEQYQEIAEMIIVNNANNDTKVNTKIGWRYDEFGDGYVWDFFITGPIGGKVASYHLEIKDQEQSIINYLANTGGFTKYQANVYNNAARSFKRSGASNGMGANSLVGYIDGGLPGLPRIAIKHTPFATTFEGENKPAGSVEYFTKGGKRMIFTTLSEAVDYYFYEYFTDNK